MTSKPLFINVAESMVMRRPIFQVGWFKACSTVIEENCDFGVFRKGPPEAVSQIARLLPFVRRAGTGGPRCVRCRWATRLALAAGFGGDQFSGGDQAFFVGKPDGLAGAHGFVGSFESGDADDGADHEIGFRDEWRRVRSRPSRG